jgi:hypothetical protein
MKTALSRDRMLLLKDGRRFVFVPHDKPRCHFCAFARTRCDPRKETACGLHRLDGKTGFWKETT